MVLHYNPNNVLRYLHMKAEIRLMTEDEISEAFMEKFREARKDYMEYIHRKYDKPIRIQLPKVENVLEDRV